MSTRAMTTRLVEKPWGRHRLWPGFADPAPDREPVGEAWFQDPEGGNFELLVKYLFTSERLSVQVHPDDDRARRAGYPRGKDEAWLILAAEPGSTIALGTREPLSHDELRTASLDGSIEGLLDWKPVRAGDYFYSAAGTVHAIGAGITLIEVQQNVDLTYRLYDYGRPRELHLEEGVAVSDARPFVAQSTPIALGGGRTLLSPGPKFVLERWSAGDRTLHLPPGREGWLVPITGSGQADTLAWRAGECLLLEGTARIDAADGADLLIACPGDAPLHVT